MGIALIQFFGNSAQVLGNLDTASGEDFVTVDTPTILNVDTQDGVQGSAYLMPYLPILIAKGMEKFQAHFAKSAISSIITIQEGSFLYDLYNAYIADEEVTEA